MSKHASSSSTSYGAWALAAWLAALALFLIWLGWVLFSTSPIEGKAEKPSLPGVAQSDPSLTAALSCLSDHIKIVPMRDAETGTCIVEMPDEIIDASASTQLENIRSVIHENFS